VNHRQQDISLRGWLAWEQFVGLYAPRVYGFARKKGLQDADAADIAQDVLRSVAQQMRQWQWQFAPQRSSFRGGLTSSEPLDVVVTGSWRAGTTWR
jgi:DNA-directed RNA polymerase specialized sigma24 family protein